MNFQPAGRISQAVEKLATGWRAVALAAFLFVLVAAFCGRPGDTIEFNRVISHKIGPLIFLLCAIPYSWRNYRAAAERPERRFWGKFAVGYGFWSLTYVPSVFFSTGPQFDAVRPFFDLGFGLAYILVISAFEERPDDRSAITELGRSPSLGHAALMMAAFYSTVVLLPAMASSKDSYFSSFVFWVAMDVIIAGRLFYFASQTASRRWRFIYLLLGAAFTLIMVVDLVTARLYRAHLPLTVGGFLDAWWVLPYAVLLVAASSGSLHFADRRGREPEPTLSDAFAASPLTWALVFPGLHFLLDRSDWLDPALQRQRDPLVIFWSLVLMAVALLRQRRVEQGLRDLVQERRDIESNLRDSEKDLRLLVERSRVSGRLRAAEERFAKAFEASPEALALSVFADGTVLDVNPAFERLTQLSRADCIGRRAEELGLWRQSRHRERMVQLLQRRRQMHDLPGELHLPDGRVRPTRVSYERITEAEGDLLLTVLRDGSRHPSSGRERIASLIENVRIPLRLVRDREAGDRPESGDAVAVFVNAGARLAIRRDRGGELEVRGGSPGGLRLLLHLKEAEKDLP